MSLRMLPRLHSLLRICNRAWPGPDKIWPSLPGQCSLSCAILASRFMKACNAA